MLYMSSFVTFFYSNLVFLVFQFEENLVIKNVKVQIWPFLQAQRL